MSRCCLVFLAFAFLSANSFAQGRLLGEVSDPAFEQQIVEKARKRLYPGGRDEEDLKVQAQLVVAVRKVLPEETEEQVLEE